MVPRQKGIQSEQKGIQSEQKGIQYEQKEIQYEQKGIQSEEQVKYFLECFNVSSIQVVCCLSIQVQFLNETFQACTFPLHLVFIISYFNVTVNILTTKHFAKKLKSKF